jgi:hypothetical protein
MRNLKQHGSPLPEVCEAIRGYSEERGFIWSGQAGRAGFREEVQLPRKMLVHRPNSDLYYLDLNVNCGSGPLPVCCQRLPQRL